MGFVSFDSRSEAEAAKIALNVSLMLSSQHDTAKKRPKAPGVVVLTEDTFTHTHRNFTHDHVCV